MVKKDWEILPGTNSENPIIQKTSVALATESSGYVCSRITCGMGPFSTFRKNFAHFDIFSTNRQTDSLTDNVQEYSWTLFNNRTDIV